MATSIKLCIFAAALTLACNVARVLVCSIPDASANAYTAHIDHNLAREAR